MAEFIMRRKAIAFNGKFLASPPSGVRRVASELVRAVGELIDSGAIATDLQARLVVPGNAPLTSSLHPRIQLTVSPVLGGFAKNIPWEQLILPWTTRHELLVNLCNLGPVFSSQTVTMIHDAQVYISPSSYSPAFRVWYRFLQPILTKRTNVVLTVSKYSRDKLVEYGVASADKIEVIHNGCDHVLKIAPENYVYNRFSVQKKGYVLAISSTQKHKNIGVLLKAFASSSLADVTLVLFGSATRRDFEAEGYTVPASTQFTGRVSDGELVSLMQGAIAFVCPSTTEGFGLPPLEAMALGCPVIIAPCGALPEVCGDAALSAPPDNAWAWEERILTIAENEEIAAELRQRALAQANRFTWATAARRLLEILIQCHD